MLQSVAGSYGGVPEQASRPADSGPMLPPLTGT
jgi:hypothetical protein